MEDVFKLNSRELIDLLNRNYNSIEKVLDTNIDYNYLLEIVAKCDYYVRFLFIYYSIDGNLPITDADIIRLLCKDTDDFYQQLSFIEEKQPRDYIELSLPDSFLSNDKVKKRISKYFEVFFEVEAERKMALLSKYQDSISSDLVSKYKNFLYLCESQPILDYIVTPLITKNLENVLDSYFEEGLSYLDCGSLSYVFKMGEDKVLKISEDKYTPDCVKDLYLIAPTETKEVKDESGNVVLILEIQDYLLQKRNNKGISKKEIKRFLKELSKLGYETDDPNTVSLRKDNFGYLNDYHDALVEPFNSHDELPEWFKKRPLVLYDVDKVYKKTI